MTQTIFIIKIKLMELLEREPYLSGLEDALAGAGTGAGSIVLVSGEAGIGKTTLITAFTRAHARRLPVLWGTCDSLFAPQPLGPLYDIAGQVNGDLPALLHANANRSLIFSAMLKELRQRTTIAVFEDVHWADEATLDLLTFLSRRIAQTRSLLILTYRDDELGPRHPLRIFLGDLAASSAVYRVPLPPFSKAAVSALTARREMDASALYRQTGGNPFFVTEVLANADSGIPSTIRDAVMARAARLSAPAYAVLEAAAVIGQRIEPWLLDKLNDQDGRAVEECMAAGMILAQTSQLSFRHELARQIIYETIDPLRRRTLHQTVLDILVSSQIAASDPAHLAHHAEAAGNQDAVLKYATLAAQQATKASAHREAAALYALASRYAARLQPREQAQLLQLYADECYLIDNRILGIELLRQALAIWRELQDALNQGAILAQMASMLISLGRDAEAIHYSLELIAILEKFPPGIELASAYRIKAGHDSFNRNFPESIAGFEKSIRLSEQFADKTEYYKAQTMLGSTMMYLDYERGCQYLENVLAEADAAGRKTTVALAYANLGSVSSELNKFHRGKQYLLKGLAYTHQHDLDRLRFYTQAWLAFTNLKLGYWNEAAEDAGRVIKDAHYSITSRLTALATLGRLRARRGDPQADVLLDEASKLSAQMGSLERLGLVYAARAEAAWLAGDMQRTLHEVNAGYNLAFDKQHPWFFGELAFWRWRAGGKVMITDWMARPYVFQIMGDWQRAAAEWQNLGCTYEQAWALADGDAGAQVAALAIFEKLDARPAAEALREKLRAAGVFNLPHRPREATRENPFGLTRRQVEILGLLTRGLSNAGIAGHLHISPKTADHHVSAILARLEVHTREAAASLASGHPYFQEK